MVENSGIGVFAPATRAHARMPGPAPVAKAEPSRAGRFVLVISADARLASRLRAELERLGYLSRTAIDAKSAAVALDHESPDAVLLDLDSAAAPESTGWLRRIRQFDASVALIALAAPTVRNAAAVAAAIEAGAFVLSAEVAFASLHVTLHRAFAERHQSDELAFFRKREAQHAGLSRLIGESNPMLRLKTQVRILLDSEMMHGTTPPVWIHGPAGTGKREVARALHFEGLRRSGPFVAVDGAALAGPEADWRLFGGPRLTAAGGPAPRDGGFVAAAEGGTLYISDLAAVAFPLQSRLLRLIENGTVAPTGAMHEFPVDVRVIAATSKPPDELLRAGCLLERLYRQLAPTMLQVVPLQERGNDLELLVQQFVEQAAARQGVAPPSLSRSALVLLASCAWPGQVRELRHVIEHAVLKQTEGQLEPSHLTLALATGTSARLGLDQPRRADLNLRRIECSALEQALARSFGNLSEAARLLGISRKTMRLRIATYGLGGNHDLRKKT